MAVGQICSINPAIFVAQPWGQNTNNTSQPAWPSDPILSSDYDCKQGPPTENRPIDIVDLVGVGHLCPQFTGDFYGRIHIVPAVINLGNLVSAQERTFEVWNAYFSAQNLASLIPDGDTTGIILTEPELAPTLYGALESRVYTLNFDLVGPAAIDVVWTFDFPSEDPTFTAFGNRVIIFAFAPDWSEPIVDKYEWLTQIIESENGIERRHRLRTNPRRSIEYQMLMDQTEKRWLERYFWTWKGRAFAVPIWQDCKKTTTLTGIGALQIDMDTTDYTSFKDGGIAILVNDYDDSEAVEIVSVNPTSLTLIRGTAGTWPIGSRIYPSQTGRMVDTISMSQPTADVTIGQIRFELVDNTALPAVDSPTPYQGDFILERAPNRASDLDVSWQSKYGLVDFSIAQPFVDDRAGFPDQVTRLNFAEGGRANIWFWMEWIMARAGKWSKFWMPSQSVDFVVVTDIDFNDTAIEVIDTQYRDFYNFSAGKSEIAIFTRDGNVYYRSISSAQEKAPPGSGIELIGIDTQLGIDYAVDEVKQVSFLHPVRMDSDTVEINWHTQEMAEINFNTRVIVE